MMTSAERMLLIEVSETVAALCHDQGLTELHDAIEKLRDLVAEQSGIEPTPSTRIGGR